MILIIFNLYGNEKIDPKLKLPVKAENWWLELTDQEQWEYFRTHYHNEILLLEASENSTEVLKENKQFIEKQKPFYPKWGFSGNTLVNLYKDELDLKLDLILGINFYRFFLKGRIFISPGIQVKVYDTIGGGLNIGLGFLM
jgi:hypothetical protein